MQQLTVTVLQLVRLQAIPAVEDHAPIKQIQDALSVTIATYAQTIHAQETVPVLIPTTQQPVMPQDPAQSAIRQKAAAEVHVPHIQWLQSIQHVSLTEIPAQMINAMLQEIVLIPTTQ